MYESLNLIHYFIFKEVYSLIHYLGRESEIATLSKHFPKAVIKKLHHILGVLDECYGKHRNYFSSGGYCLIIGTAEDLHTIDDVVSLGGILYEWVEQIGDHLCALTLKGDDFSIVLFMPINISPKALIQQMKGSSK